MEIPFAENGGEDDASDAPDDDPCPEPEQGDKRDQPARVGSYVPDVGMFPAETIGGIRIAQKTGKRTHG